jgi:hypothetical protein
MPLATLGDERHVADEALDAGGALVGATLSWIKSGNRRHKDLDNTVLGTLRVDAQRLVVDVNSARRRKRIEREIAKRLGSGATLVESKVTDLYEALEERRAGESLAAGESEDAPPDVLPRTPEIEALEAELARKHWDAWFTTKVPALGNRTPQQAAKTPAGRERLEALLAEYSQRTGEGRNAFDPDVEALRRKLGLTGG